MVEATTGWLETYPVPHATARNTILGLEKQILWRHGTPERIESDNGTHFKNSLINTWAREHGIEWVYHIPYHAPAAGKVERCNGLLKTTLKALGGGTFKSWEINLAKATWLVNTQEETTFKVSPREEKRREEKKRLSSPLLSEKRREEKRREEKRREEKLLSSPLLSSPLLSSPLLSSLSSPLLSSPLLSSTNKMRLTEGLLLTDEDWKLISASGDEQGTWPRIPGGEELSSPREISLEAKDMLEKVQHLMSTRQAHRCDPGLPFKFIVVGRLPHLHGVIFQWRQNTRMEQGKGDPLLIIEWVFLSHQRSKRMPCPQELVAELIQKARVQIRELDGCHFECIHIPIGLRSGQITKVMLEHLLQENESLQFALDSFTRQISIHWPAHKIFNQDIKFTLSLKSVRSRKPLEALTVFTDTSGRSHKSVMTWKDPQQWEADVAEVEGSPQVAEMAIVVRAFERFPEPFNLVLNPLIIHHFGANPHLNIKERLPVMVRDPEAGQTEEPHDLVTWDCGYTCMSTPMGLKRLPSKWTRKLQGSYNPTESNSYRISPPPPPGHRCEEFEGMCCFNLSTKAEDIHKAIQSLWDMVKNIKKETNHWLSGLFGNWGISDWTGSILKTVLLPLFIFMWVLVAFGAIKRMLIRLISSITLSPSVNHAVIPSASELEEDMELGEDSREEDDLEEEDHGPESWLTHQPWFAKASLESEHLPPPFQFSSS
ncbi:hypothetical protein DUI87_29819 [Hirundo rustica rustica]|uniref:Integrase catalytic domain-containing protein n=1 Tax=Hirundo rustica rustica TaxID=333673 RepID=A0A3M0IYD8_HIRRU|nr:hypothetical protein DUI87_29819 [Hirundo rustica rustica]